MNLPPALLNQLQSEEELEEVMAQARMITVPQAAAARSGETVTTTTTQATVVECQLIYRQNKKRKAAAPQTETPNYQPGEYELKVIQKRKRKEERLIELGLCEPGTTKNYCSSRASSAARTN
jgi:hypothetical protein